MSLSDRSLSLLMRDYHCRLFWVLCKPHPPENVFSDDEEETSPDHVDPFSCSGYPNPLECAVPWWPDSPPESSPAVEDVELDSLADGFVRSDVWLRRKRVAGWQRAVTRTSINVIYLRH